jgi:hypothetical protein
MRIDFTGVLVSIKCQVFQYSGTRMQMSTVIANYKWSRKETELVVSFQACHLFAVKFDSYLGLSYSSSIRDILGSSDERPVLRKAPRSTCFFFLAAVRNKA